MEIVRPDPDVMLLPARLGDAAALIRSVLDGDKPRISEDHWLYHQLGRMDAGLFICDPAKVLVTLPGDGPEQIAMKGDTRFHPLTYSLIKRQENLRHFLGRAGVHNYKIFGVDDDYRDTSRNPLEITADTGAVILPRADLYALWQFVTVLKDRLESGEKHPVLVVQNSEGAYWHDMITGLGLDRHTSYLRKAAGLFITPGLRDTEKLLTHILPDKDRKPAEPEYPQISTLILATSGSHKIAELRRILNTNLLPKRVLPLRSVLKKPREVPEDGRTCPANAMQKVHAAIEMVDGDMGLEAACAVFRKRGIDPATVWMVTDDRSLETVEDLTRHKIFDACRQHLNTYRPTPGPELALVLKGMSRDDMFKGMELSARRLAGERKARKENPHVDLTARNWTIYAMTPLVPDAEGKRRTRLFAGATVDTLVFDPRPKAEVMYSEAFVSPANDPEGRTHAEIPRYIETRSDRALAAHVAIASLGMAHDRGKVYGLNGAFETIAKPARWRIATPQSLRLGAKTHGPGGVGKSLNGSFRLVSGARGKYDGACVTQPGLSDNEKVRLALRKFGTLFDDADCLLFTGEYNQREADDNFFKNGIFFFSPQVGKAVADPTMAEKPYAVVVSPTSQPYIALYNHLHKHGLIGDQPDNVFKKCMNPAQAVTWFKRAMKTYIPDNVTENRFWATQNSVRPDGDLFRVSVYGSATSTNKNKREATRNFCWDLSAMSFAVENGGGKDGIMIESSTGVRDFRAWWAENRPGKAMPKTHVSSIQCEDTYQMEGLCDFNDYVCVHPTIWDRMADLSDCDAEVLDIGGGGSIQEFMVSGYLRQIGLRPSVNRPMIIVNSEIGEGHFKTRVFDQLVAAIPARWFRELNIHVVNTHEEALPILIEARRARGMEPTITAPDVLTARLRQQALSAPYAPQLRAS